MEAATQDIELTIEQAEEAAKKAAHSAGVALGLTRGRGAAGGSIIEESGCEREEAGTIAGESQQAQTLGSSHAAIGYEGLAQPFSIGARALFRSVITGLPVIVHGLERAPR